VNPAGSMWRRWDPHLHLPGTLFNDQFGGMSLEAALNELAVRAPTIEAAGITDYYYTTTIFRQAYAAWQGGAGESIKFMFPNVELRLDNATSQESAVNIHLLCPPDQVEELDQFLARLEFTSSSGQPYRCDRPGLCRLGRDFSRDPNLNDSAALRIGAEQFKVNFEGLLSSFRTDAWAKRHCLVAVAGGERDGTSGVRSTDGAFVERRRSIEAFAHMIFSANPNQAAFWLGQGVLSVDEMRSAYGALKPCLHGSDAHTSGALGQPAFERYTWLKGDPTFDTLRIACLAPKTRVVVAEQSPVSAQSHGRVSRVTVADPSGFLGDGVDINIGLVAIIGARGSGKTALADLIAAGAGSDEPLENPGSFIRRAIRLLSETAIEVEWNHGEITRYEFNKSPESNEWAPRRIRYLSQQFVERLCTTEGISDELLAEIERVVFNAWPVAERQGATTFRELLDARLGSARSTQHVELARIADAGERIVLSSVSCARNFHSCARRELRSPAPSTRTRTRSAR